MHILITSNLLQRTSTDILLNLQSFLLHGSPGRETSNEAWMQHTSLDHRSAFLPLSGGEQQNHTERTAHLTESRRYSLSENPPVHCVPGTDCSPGETPNRGRYEKNTHTRKQHRSEKPGRLGYRSTSFGTDRGEISRRNPSNHHSSRFNAQQSDGRGFNDREPVNNGQHLNQPILQQRDSDGYLANDEFLSTTDTSSSGDTELLRPDEEDPFAGKCLNNFYLKTIFI